jgi:hypothetical protein
VINGSATLDGSRVPRLVFDPCRKSPGRRRSRTGSEDRSRGTLPILNELLK